jgi:hypothetical protein
MRSTASRLYMRRGDGKNDKWKRWKMHVRIGHIPDFSMPLR